MAKKKPATKKNTKVTPEEKMAIFEAMADGQTVAEIADKINRTEICVKKYVGLISEQVKSIQKESDKDDFLSSREIYVADPKQNDSYQVVLAKLVTGGMVHADAEKRVAKCLANANKNQLEKVNAKDLYEAALKVSDGSDLYSTKSENLQGITVMTKAGSERSDEVKKMKKSTNLKNAVDGKRIFTV